MIRAHDESVFAACKRALLAGEELILSPADLQEMNDTILGFCRDTFGTALEAAKRALHGYTTLPLNPQTVEHRRQYHRAGIAAARAIADVRAALAKVRP